MTGAGTVPEGATSGPLSEREQRLLDQIERALQAEDPKLVSALHGSYQHKPSPSLWVLETLRTSCDLLIFVYQAAEAVASYNPVKLRRGVLGKGS